MKPCYCSEWVCRCSSPATPRNLRKSFSNSSFTQDGNATLIPDDLKRAISNQARKEKSEQDLLRDMTQRFKDEAEEGFSKVLVSPIDSLYECRRGTVVSLATNGCHILFETTRKSEYVSHNDCYFQIDWQTP